MILLIKKLNKTRDNSTGFTIQWGTGSSGNNNFPRSYGYVTSVVATHSIGSSEGVPRPTGIYLINVNTFYYKTNENAGMRWIATGFC